jgi:hypothetical protein
MELGYEKSFRLRSVGIKNFSVIREFYYLDLAFFVLSKHGFSQRISEEPGVSKPRVFVTQTADKFKHVRSRVTRRSFFVSDSAVHVLASNLPVNTAQGYASFQVSALEVD